MPRGKVTLQPIRHESKRRAAFKQRKAGLFKKARELSILCNIDLCAIVYDESSGPNPDVFTTVSDLSTLLSRYLSFSKEAKDKIVINQRKILRKQREEFRKIELENMRSMLDRVDRKLAEVNERIRELQNSEPAVVHHGLVPVPVPCMSVFEGECSLHDWMVPVTSFGPLGETMKLQDCSLPAYIAESSHLSDLVVPTKPVNGEGELGDIVGSSTCIADSIEFPSSGESQVSFNGSNGSDTCSLELNQDDCIHMDDLFDSMDLESIGSFDFESIGSFERQDTNVSDLSFIEMTDLEDDVIRMEPFYNLESYDEGRDYLSLSDIEFI